MEFFQCTCFAHQTSGDSSPESTLQYDLESELRTFFERYPELPITAEEIVRTRRYLVQNFPNYMGECPLFNFYDCIVSVIESFRITNSDVVRKALKLCAMHMLERHRMFLKILESSSLVGKSPKSDIYYELMPGHVKKFSFDSFFYQPLSLMDFPEIQILLRYGLRFGAEDDDLRIYIKHTTLCLLVNAGLTEYASDEEDFPEDEEEKSPPEWQIKEMQGLVNEHYPAYDNRRRLYFVLLGTELVILKRECDDNYRDISESLQLLFETIPEPLVTVIELRRFLKVTLRDEYFACRVEAFCDDFIEIFPNNPKLPEPRTLKHLCRCQVRECLIQSGKLPHGIWSLPLPNQMQNYIVLQDNQPYYHKDFITRLEGTPVEDDDDTVYEKSVKE